MSILIVTKIKTIRFGCWKRSTKFAWRSSLQHALSAQRSEGKEDRGQGQLSKWKHDKKKQIILIDRLKIIGLIKSNFLVKWLMNVILSNARKK